MDGLYVDFSEAARAGDLDVLKKCTRKDANRRDFDGMSPVQWAASYGNLEALKILVGKGGNPDKPNNEGMTSLHLAAATGQLHCLVYLTNFGGNIYSMNDNGTTPIQEAAHKSQFECVRHLEAFITHQVQQDRLKVEKMQEKAKRDAQRRIKEKRKLLKKLDRDYERKAAKNRKLGGDPHKYTNVYQNGHSNGKIRLGNLDNDKKMTYSQLTGLSPTSDEMNLSKIDNLDDESSITSSFRRIEDEFLATASLTSDDILFERSIYVNSDQVSETTDHTQVTTSTNTSSFKRSDVAASIKSIPISRPLNGFGLSAQPGPLITLKNGKIITTEETIKEGISNGHLLGKPTRNGYLKNGYFNNRTNPNGKNGLTALPERQMGSLYTFLHSLQLDECRQIFLNEKIDLDACLLCDEKDLKEIGLQLGPRKKILDAIKQRNNILAAGSEMNDTCV